MKNAVIAYLNSTPWAIMPGYLDTIHGIVYSKYFSGKTAEERVAEAEALKGRELNNNPTTERIEVGVPGELPGSAAGSGARMARVAVIPVVGPISKRMNMMSAISEGASAEIIKSEISAALADDSVDAIVLRVDTPGGTVPGIQDLSDYIYNSRESKPIVTFVDGLMASGGLWIGTSATKVVVGEETARVGSLGVITAHYDKSIADERAGVKKTYIYAGKYKAIGADNAPLSPEDKDVIQSEVDSLYTIFVNSVARNRGTTPDEVLDKMADARMFLAREAMECGLVDDIMTLDDAIKMAATMAIKKDGEADNRINNNNHKEVIKMEDELKAQIEALQAQVATLTTRVTELTAENLALTKEVGIATATISNIKAEHADKEDSAEAARISGEVLASSTLPGKIHDKVVAQVDWKTFRVEGRLDGKAYSDALKVEVTDWQEKLGSTQGHVPGVGGAKEDGSVDGGRFETAKAEFAEILAL